MDLLLLQTYAGQTASFVALGVIAALMPAEAREFPHGRQFRWLAAFGLIRGGLGFVELWTLEPVPRWWTAALLAVSFACLFEFTRRLFRDVGRRTSAGWTPYTSLAVFIAVIGATLLVPVLATNRVAAYDAAIRYLIVLPGGVGAAIALHLTMRGTMIARVDRWLTYALCAGFATYGLLAGLFVDPWAGLPVWMPTSGSTLAVTGLPVAVFRAAAIAVAALCLGALAHRASHRAGLQLRRQTQELEALTASLESRVAERTAALRGQEAFAQHLINGTPAIIVLLSPEGRIKHVNPAFERLTGWTLQEVRGREWLTLLPRREVSSVGRLLQVAIAGTPACGNVNPILTRSGDERELEWYDQVLRDGTGTVTGLVAMGIDVTERRQAEKAADALRRRQSNILDSMFAMVGVFDLAGNLLEANRAPLELAGLEPEDVIGRPFWETYWWSYSPVVQEQVRSALSRAARGNIVREDFVIRVAGGLFITIDAMFGPLRNADGTIVEVIGSAVDVTDRQRAEQALRESETRLRAIFESEPECVKIVARDGTLLDMNPAGLRLIGASTLDSLRSLRVFDLIDAQYHDLYREAIDAVFRGESSQDQYQIVAPDGSRRWMEQHAVPMRDSADPSRVTAMLAVTRDITSRRSMEVALRQSEQRLRQAQAIAAIGNWELDVAAGALWWSDEIYSIFEIDQRRFGASYTAFLEAIHPGDREAVNAAYTASLVTRQPYHITHRIQTADGRVKHVEERCETDFAADGAPLRSRGTVQEITVRVEAEEALRASVREKETLLREVHHRVKNNLQIVSSLLHFQAKKVKRPEDLAAFDDARARLRAMSLVHEKLYRSRELSAILMHDYLKELIGGVRQSHAAPNQSVTVELTADPIYLSVETAMPVGMIVGELLTNVFKHAFPTNRRNGRAAVHLTTSGGQAEIGVTDDGVGLPETFSPESGESFGWQMVMALTAQLEGELRVTRGAGTSVVITFPMAERARTPAPTFLSETG
ncbi:MAG: PAS domain S-box protein [Vicinamibacterales bacterium]|jgi:PAS domain S-box-containing protein